MARRESEKPKCVVVGTGSIGRRHIENLLAEGANVEVVTTGRSGWKESNPRINTHDSIEPVFGADPDLVVIANPTSFHASSAIEALATGALVLVEKPLCGGPDEIQSLRQLAPYSRSRLAVAYNYRFHDAIIEFKRLVRSGVIGRLYAIKSDVGQYLPDWHPGEDYRKGYAARSELGGGAIRTLSHELDYVDWIVEEQPIQVCCISKRLSSLEIDVEDSAAVTVDYPSALAEFHLDMVRKPASRSLSAYGSDGVLFWDDCENQITHTASDQDRKVVWSGDGSERDDSFRSEARAALGSVGLGYFDERFGDPFRAAQLIEAAHLSARSGIHVEWTKIDAD